MLSKKNMNASGGESSTSQIAVIEFDHQNSHDEYERKKLQLPKRYGELLDGLEEMIYAWTHPKEDVPPAPTIKMNDEGDEIDVIFTIPKKCKITLDMLVAIRNAAYAYNGVYRSVELNLDKGNSMIVRLWGEVADFHIIDGRVIRKRRRTEFEEEKVYADEEKE